MKSKMCISEDYKLSNGRETMELSANRTFSDLLRHTAFRVTYEASGCCFCLNCKCAVHACQCHATRLPSHSHYIISDPFAN